MAGRDGNGNFTLSFPAFVGGTVISSSEANQNGTDLSTALSQSIAVDGQSTITGNIPLFGFKVTGLGAGASATDSANLGQIQANAYAYQATDTGAADAYVIALFPAISTQAAGLVVAFVAANDSTGPSTLNAGGGADAIEYQGAALTGAEIATGATIVCEHDGTAFQMVSPSALLGPTGLSAVVDDTSPQLGGFLDTNSFSINESEGNPIASATTTDIFGGNDGNTLHITGTTTIVDFTDASSIGQWRKIIFDGILTLTHGSGITLPGGSNITTAVGDYAFVYADAVDAFTVLYFKIDGTAVVAPPPGLVQEISTPDGVVATGTTQIPHDNTIPQNTEGTEFITVTITPTNATHRLVIEGTLNFSLFTPSVTASGLIVALFQDSGSDALDTAIISGASLDPARVVVPIRYEMVAGTTSATTFKIRAGGRSPSTVTFNGDGGAAQFGGTNISDLRVREITA